MPRGWHWIIVGDATRTGSQEILMPDNDRHARLWPGQYKNPWDYYRGRREFLVAIERCVPDVLDSLNRDVLPFVLALKGTAELEDFFADPDYLVCNEEPAILRDRIRPLLFRWAK